MYSGLKIEIKMEIRRYKESSFQLCHRLHRIVEPKPGAGTNVIISNDLRIHFPGTAFLVDFIRELLVELLVFFSVVFLYILFWIFPFHWWP